MVNPQIRIQSKGSPTDRMGEEIELDDGTRKLVLQVIRMLPEEPRGFAQFLSRVEKKLNQIPQEMRSIVFGHAKFELHCRMPKATDLTFYLEARVGIEQFLRQESKSEPRLSYDCEIPIQDDSGGSEEGRVLACSCFGGRHWSLTLRKKEGAGKEDKPKPIVFESTYRPPRLLLSLSDSLENALQSGARSRSAELRKVFFKQVCKPLLAKQKKIRKLRNSNKDADVAARLEEHMMEEDMWQFSPDRLKSIGQNEAGKAQAQCIKLLRRDQDRSERLNGIDEICEVLYEAVFPESVAEAKGLVVVTGRTASAKSTIVRGLIWQYLVRRGPDFVKSKKRNPHLITFEDPIETYYFGEKRPIQGKGLDYTPREKGNDTKNVTEVLRDALRQTPAVVFVSETREPYEWKELLKFAGTGHLAFTTSHAGSLAEAMGKIFEHTGTKGSADRGVIADRILALIHIRDHTIRYGSGNKKELRILIPSIWRKTPSGAKELIAEGRASLLPHSSSESSTVGAYEPLEGMAHAAQAVRSPPSSLGRYYFAERLTSVLKDAFPLERFDPELLRRKEYEEARKKILRASIAWDLEGT